ncbi:uncharacterized protein N7459_008207 [Penicillium hispanicum]|uniref:uncharacterized protein n=1 Tax=Penicillium hispanicum TaxID=1080232 RepID=UPI0025411F70|nr:uncharacterized protein N7459_008207 [Penicillium hispanicum]KAJ5573780.1 hypothetical protein N7459_008207 [Penicillium hispanicum]
MASESSTDTSAPSNIQGSELDPTGSGPNPFTNSGLWVCWPLPETFDPNELLPGAVLASVENELGQLPPSRRETESLSSSFVSSLSEQPSESSPHCTNPSEAQSNATPSSDSSHRLTSQSESASLSVLSLPTRDEILDRLHAESLYYLDYSRSATSTSASTSTSTSASLSTPESGSESDSSSSASLSTRESESESDSLLSEPLSAPGSESESGSSLSESLSASELEPERVISPSKSASDSSQSPVPAPPPQLSEQARRARIAQLPRFIYRAYATYSSSTQPVAGSSPRPAKRRLAIVASSKVLGGCDPIIEPPPKRYERFALSAPPAPLFNRPSL